MKIMYAPYKRSGLTYKCVIQYTIDGRTSEIIGSLDFISYHLIKYLYGEEFFEEMALNRIDKLKQELGI